MARSRIPNPIDRRHLIEKELSEAQSLQIAEAYLEEGRVVEAIEFLAKASARDRLAELRSAAVESGDVFLLRSAARAMREPPTHDEWSGIAAAAEAGGRELQAAEARRQLERGKAGGSA
jgi:hypothetical protein